MALFRSLFKNCAIHGAKLQGTWPTTRQSQLILHTYLQYFLAPGISSNVLLPLESKYLDKHGLKNGLSYNISNLVAHELAAMAKLF